ncbi:MAG: hypothetical protein AAF413_00985 [Patescibacteria group bacterium]
MYDGETLPVLVKDQAIPGLSHVIALHVEVADMRQRVENIDTQRAHEVKLGERIHDARREAILTSALLSDILGLTVSPDDEEPDTDTNDTTDSRIVNRPPTVDQITESAFFFRAPRRGVHALQRRNLINDALLDAAANRGLRKRAWQSAHPDTNEGAKVEKTAKAIGASDRDPKTAILTMLSAGVKPTDEMNLTELRDERYLLQLYLDSTDVNYRSKREATTAAKREVDMAGWRVRSEAAGHLLGLLVGSDEEVREFAESNLRYNDVYSIERFNSDIVKIWTLLERIKLGNPREAKRYDEAKVDEILEHIWEVHAPSDKRRVSSPPHTNWLPILIDALELMDPGESEGVRYTYFEPPIKLTRVPQPTRLPSRNTERGYPYDKDHYCKDSQETDSNIIYSNKNDKYEEYYNT